MAPDLVLRQGPILLEAGMTKKKLAVLFDGGHISKVFETVCGRPLRPRDVVTVADRIVAADEELFRLYYYNAPPFDRVVTDPITGTQLDFSRSAITARMNTFH